MQLNKATWCEVEKYLTANDAIILPVGSTEQHGPTGLLGTDALVAEAVAAAVGEKLQIYVTPTLSVAMAQHHMAFPGSMTLRPQTMIDVLVDWFSSLVKHGFKKIFIINGHGGNIPAIQAAVSQLHANSSLGGSLDTGNTHIELKNVWDGKRVPAHISSLFENRNGDHASADELSIVKYLFPDDSNHSPPQGWQWPGEGMREFGNCDHYRSLYPDGSIAADISLASADAGKILFDATVEDMADFCSTFTR